MKKLIKMFLVAIPALVVAAAVGTTTIGCGDDTTTTTVGDMAVPVVHDMAKGVGPDLTPKGD
ncbi:MAG TPA: hypothetical protein VF945_11995 [Polyangia bacterium]